MKILNFINAKVLVAGRGISGLGAKQALSNAGAFVVTYSDGEEFVDDDYDLIVLSPSFEKTHFLYEYAKKKRIRIIGEYALGVQFNSKPLIAITGTNGKTTTTQMLGKILQDKGGKVSGNVGSSFALDASKCDYDIAITEVSSFQLEQTPYLKPKIAIITNITQDHLSRHKTMDEYANIKYSITRYQSCDDYLILPYSEPMYGIEKLETDAKVLFVSIDKKVNGCYIQNEWVYCLGEKLFKQSALGVSENHNKLNALYAVLAGKLMNASCEQIEKGLRYFVSSNHRIQYVGSINGVSFYDDSKSTNVYSVIKAIECMKGNTALILCGNDKGLDYTELFYHLDGVSVIFACGDIAKIVSHTASKLGYKSLKIVKDLESAVVSAYLKKPDNVLLSPGSSSFDCYSSYVERGKDFVRIVGELANGGR